MTHTHTVNTQKLRIEIGTADREIWLWPVAVRAPMAHSRNVGGVYIEDSKTSYQMNPSVGYTLGGGFHCTTFECIAQIFREGLHPGGGGDRINTFFVPFAPWDERSKSVLRFKRIDGTDLVYIYMTYESLSKFSPRVSADGHILVQQTIPFNSFDAVWHYDWKDEEFYRLMITKGYEQLVLSVKGAPLKTHLKTIEPVNLPQIPLVFSSGGVNRKTTSASRAAWNSSRPTSCARPRETPAVGLGLKQYF